MKYIEKEKIELNRFKNCAVTGHREITDVINQKRLTEIFTSLLRWYDTFLIGMAVGFDTKCFEILLSLKKDFPVKIIACVPNREQAKYFSEKDKKEYYELLEKADGVIILSENYYKNCMYDRNKFMVDNSSCLVAYKRKNTGGTAYTVNYAEKKGVPVIKI